MARRWDLFLQTGFCDCGIFRCTQCNNDRCNLVSDSEV